MNQDTGNLDCNDCKSDYLVRDGIPSMLHGGADTQDWNPWDLDEVIKLGDTFYKRAKGELPEKESSKSFANFIHSNNLHSQKDSYLDIGCATGHYLRSYRRIIDEEFTYTGIDITEQYLHWGKEIFGLDEYCNFVHCDAMNLPFLPNSFSYVLINLFHFFPNLTDALQQAINVAEKMVIWRTPIGEVNCVAKMILNDQSFETVGSLSLENTNQDQCIYFLYTKEYLEGLIKSLGGEIVLFERDHDFGEMDTSSLKDINCIPHTKVIANMQIMGNLYLDWHYVGIKTKA